MHMSTVKSRVLKRIRTSKGYPNAYSDYGKSKSVITIDDLWVTTEVPKGSIWKALIKLKEEKKITFTSVLLPTARSYWCRFTQREKIIREEHRSVKAL